MGNLRNIKILVLTFAIVLITSCGSSMRGTASDRSGTNGATNGTGKIAK